MKTNSKKRQTGKKKLKKDILILCCGKTEQSYFQYYRRFYHMELQNVKIKIVPSKQNISLSMVDEAISNKNDYFEVWVVFDRDSDLKFDQAITKALNNNIKCAFSNAAFEYWLLLHLIDKSGIIQISELISDLTKLLRYKYEKNKNIQRVCGDIIESTKLAEKRAKLRHEEHKKDNKKKYSDWCSCTTVYELTKRLREWESINRH